MKNTIKTRFLAVVIIIAILQAYIWPLSYVIALSDDLHEYFTEILLKEESENGKLVANVLEGKENIVLTPNKDYYLCIKAKTPNGTSDGYFTIQLGDNIANGLQFINIPGQTYKPRTN